MQRSLIATLAIGASTVLLLASGALPQGYAQTNAPQSDEFNANSFSAPFTVSCGTLAVRPCPDAQGTTTWSLNGQSPGNLRIWTQPGTLLGAANNARNLVLQPVSPSLDYTITTKLTYPANTNAVTTAGQTAGIIVYQNDDNFIYLGRDFVNGASQLEFVQEANGVDALNQVTEPNPLPNSGVVYLSIHRTGNLYQAFYSYTNPVADVAIPPGQFPAPTATATITNTPTGTSTATVGPTATTPPVTTNTTGYTAVYNPVAVGLFAWGGPTALPSTNQYAADFDWFRVGNSLTPGPTAGPTSTAVVSVTPSVTATVPTSTATVTTTATTAPTSTSTPVPTNTPIPTPTPKPTPPKKTRVRFQYVSIWYHVMQEGTYERIQVQANLHSKLGIWVHVWFPNGKHYQWFTNTDSHGFWGRWFLVPYHVITRHSNQALVTFRLWHGSDNIKNYSNFTIVPHR